MGKPYWATSQQVLERRNIQDSLRLEGSEKSESVREGPGVDATVSHSRRFSEMNRLELDLEGGVGVGREMQPGAREGCSLTGKRDLADHSPGNTVWLWVAILGLQPSQAFMVPFLSHCLWLELSSSSLTLSSSSSFMQFFPNTKVLSQMSPLAD